MICINCGSEENGKYCSNCSQKLTVKRITLKEGWYDFWARVYGFDGMFPRTFRDLTLRPGYVARQFINGIRARYYGPVGYFFLMITLYLIFLNLIGLDMMDFVKRVNEDMNTTSVGNQQMNKDAMEGIQRFTAENIKLLAFLYIPFLTFASRYIFFRKQKLNFLEHAILPFYALGHWYWVMLIMAVVLRLTGYLIPTFIDWILTAAYFGWCYVSFAPDQQKVKVFFKGFFVYVVGFIMVIIFFGIVGAVVGILIAILNPELFKQMYQQGK